MPQILVGKPEIMTHIGKLRPGEADNIKIDVLD
jgi:hypothetical protein